MSDHFDETARRMGKPLEAFGGRGLKKMLITAAAIACVGFCCVCYDLFFGVEHSKPTYVGAVLMLAAAAYVAWRGREKSRALTVCRHGLVVQENARETEYMWDEIAHVMIGRNTDPAERGIAVVLIDGKRIEFAPQFFQSEESGHRQEACVRLLRSYVRDVRRG